MSAELPLVGAAASIWNLPMHAFACSDVFWRERGWRFWQYQISSMILFDTIFYSQGTFALFSLLPGIPRSVLHTVFPLALTSCTESCQIPRWHRICCFVSEPHCMGRCFQWQLGALWPGFGDVRMYSTWGNRGTHFFEKSCLYDIFFSDMQIPFYHDLNLIDDTYTHSIT